MAERKMYYFEKETLKRMVIKSAQEFCEMIDCLDEDKSPGLFFSQEDSQGFHVNIDAGFDPSKKVKL